VIKTFTGEDKKTDNTLAEDKKTEEKPAPAEKE